jgi:glycosyltransferase involved in cell wall biosynthesis
MGTSSSHDSPHVTVLTTAYNAARFLEETIESLQAQTFTDWEHIVVDDASDDETSSIVQRHVDRDARFRLIRRTVRGGPFTAANEGLAHARGRYVARLDADDVFVPARLEKGLRFLAANPQLRACAGFIDVLIDGAVHKHRVEPLPRGVGSVKWSVCVRTFMPCTLIVEAAALRELGGYVEIPPVAQDHRLTCQLAGRRWLGIVPEVLAHWRKHEAQISSRELDMQSRIANEIVAEHLAEITDQSWSMDDVATLRRIGHADLAIRSAFRAIRLFEDTWRADASLTEEERLELAVFVRELRVRHVKERAAGCLRFVSVGRALYASAVKRRARTYDEAAT